MVKITITKMEAKVLQLICQNNSGYGGTAELNAEQWWSLGKKFAKEVKDVA